LSRLQLTLNRAASPSRAVSILIKTSSFYIYFNIDFQEETPTPVVTRNSMTSGVSSGIGSQTPSMPGRPRNPAVKK